MKSFLSQFKINEDNKNSVALEFLFDFAVVALVSLIISGIIVNNNIADMDQIVFMILNAGLLSVHWYSYIFFKQRYTKKNSFYRIWMFFKILGLLIMAVGIDLMVFIKNQADSNRDFLKWFSMVIFLAGFIFSRFFVMLGFAFGLMANKGNKVIFKLAIYKCISRALTMIIGLIHITLVIIYKQDIIPLTTFICVPLYLVIELLGNIINVNDRNMKKAPKVSFEYTKERYSKLNILYIASFFVAGTIQFAYYFHTVQDIHMLGSILAAYIIGFLMWWSFIDRIYKFKIKNNAKSLNLFAFINIIESFGLVLMGAMSINSHKTFDSHFMPPLMLFGLVIVLLSYLLSEFTFAKGTEKINFNKQTKKDFMVEYIIAIFILITISIISIFFTFPMYAAYIIVISILIILNSTSKIKMFKWK